MVNSVCMSNFQLCSSPSTYLQTSVGSAPCAGLVVYTRTGILNGATTTQTALAINCDVTRGKRRLHYYYEGCTLLLMYSIAENLTTFHG